MRTLVITSRTPTSDVSGYDLRVHHLCRHTPGELHLAVIALGPDGGDSSGALAPGFASTRRFEGLVTTDLSPRRHLRTTDGRWLRSSRPRRFAETAQQLAAHAADLEVDLVVVFGGDLAEVARALGHPHTVLDVCDSVTLTRRRQLEVAPPRGVVARLSGRVALARTKALEAELPRLFARVTAISEQDSQQLRDLAGAGAVVVTVSNGVDERFLSGMLPAGRRRGVAFWGNLEFAPNQDSMRYFFSEVYPLLRDDGVEVRLIGPNAPVWLQEVARAEPGVELLGFVPDLREALDGFPVAINAMRTGSGLKNKVLEAFGLGLVVVTTTRGIEALPGIEDGAHVRVADDAVGLATAVRELLEDTAECDRIRDAAHDLLVSRYRWSLVGEAWRALLPVSKGDHGSPGS